MQKPKMAVAGVGSLKQEASVLLPRSPHLPTQELLAAAGWITRRLLIIKTILEM